jgi:hypothetical protein
MKDKKERKLQKDEGIIRKRNTDSTQKRYKTNQVIKVMHFKVLHQQRGKKKQNTMLLSPPPLS